MYKSIASLLICLFTVSASFGQDKRIETKLDSLLTKQFKPAEPGCAVLVAKHGQIIYKKAFGSANLELNVPLKPDMVFNLASITKQFTAVAILQLVAQGKISLQDSLQKFIPDFPSKGHIITIENLLTHTSGIKDYMQIDYRNLNMERWDFSPKQLIDSFKNYALDFEPGTKFSYSNSGYYLLGYITQKASGKRYQSYIQDNLLKPLGLTRSYFDSANIIIPGRVNGYRKDGSSFRNVDYWSPTIEYAAGGLISNVEDLFRWHVGLYSYKILKKEMLKKAFTPYHLKDGTTTGYGYGWFVRTSNGVKSIEHGGGMPGFLTNEIYYPDSDTYIAVLCNNGTVSMNDLTVNIAQIVLDKRLQENLHVAPNELDKYVGVYQLSIDKNRTITILKENGHLIAKVSETETIPLVFQSPTKFQFKNMLDAHCEFVTEDGKVTKFNVSQHGHYEWIKIK
ncbi:serine hydrolase domain-containing protein [Arachidicoccus terrestris]|uniref:serine hydrolase domain-containing protein n=1 Tax=Arachidicoccus terrestris TaxID=2875539 RepID=UPI001CC5746F|nr:serine hydrolase domain-containing protein [Arachidicoccus terrestris]UAY55712.1 beta-lactamase family protein [Arachidicoccus terrestris]